MATDLVHPGEDWVWELSSSWQSTSEQAHRTTGFAAPQTTVCEQQPRDSLEGELAGVMGGDPEQVETQELDHAL